MDLATLLAGSVQAARAYHAQPENSPAVPAFPVSHEPPGNGQIIEDNNCSRNSRSSREQNTDSSSGQEIDAQARARADAGERARVCPAEARELREQREMLAGPGACSSRSFSQKRELREKTGTGTLLPATGDLAAWRAGLAQLDPEQPPCPGYRSGEWRHVLANAVTFLDEHGPWAEKLGWKTHELFGVHAEAGVARVDACGALVLKSGRVRWLTHSEVQFENDLVFRRKPSQPVGVPLWQFPPLALPPIPENACTLEAEVFDPWDPPLF